MQRDLKQLRIVRRAEVLGLTGLSRASLYRFISEGRFPGPVKLGSNSVGWRESDLRAWLESREPAEAALTRTIQGKEPGGAAR